MTTPLPHWADEPRAVIPAGGTSIALRAEDSDPRTAVVFARLAPRVLAAARHMDDLDALTGAQIEDLLGDVAALHTATSTVLDHLIVAARRPEGNARMSWQDLANTLGVHRATAQTRHRQAQRGSSTDQTTDQGGDPGSWVEVILCRTGHTEHEHRHGQIIRVDEDGSAQIHLGTDPDGTQVCYAAEWQASTLPAAVRAERAHADAGWTGPK
jgi:hypothetical protein